MVVRKEFFSLALLSIGQSVDETRKESNANVYNKSKTLGYDRFNGFNFSYRGALVVDNPSKEAGGAVGVAQKLRVERT